MQDKSSRGDYVKGGVVNGSIEKGRLSSAENLCSHKHSREVSPWSESPVKRCVDGHPASATSVTDLDLTG
jgi:hypothetical protein